VADFQDPIEMIKKFVEKWEEGYEVVAGIKTKSKEKRIMRFFRTIYYKLARRICPVDMLEHFTGFALYDNRFIETLKKVPDPMPFLRGLVTEFCGNYTTITYTQARRRAGKTSFNFPRLYDAAMLSITTYSKRPPRYATVWGAILSGLTFAGLIAMGIVQIFSPISWMYFLFMGLGFFGFLNLFFIGMLGEYTVNMNKRLLDRPLVIEEERIGCGGG
jgi:hypothetical protein